MPGTVTQKQIADYVGATPVLVSRALNNHPSVALHTRERVQEVARQLGYNARSNQSAREMAARRHGKRAMSNIIALVTASSLFEDSAVASLPYFREIVRGIEEVAGHRGLDLFICTYNERHQPSLLLNGGVDGVICLGSSTAALHALPLPIVTFESADDTAAAQSTRNRLHCLAPDNRLGARLATEHLLALGHRRIACLAFSSSFGGGHRYFVAADRIDGYKDALAGAGIALDERLIGGHLAHPTTKGGAEGMGLLLETAGKDFTGLVCFNDLAAMGAIDVLRERGCCVPEDVSVVGFDDVSEAYPFEPKVTSIRFNRFEMGRRAVDVICTARTGDDAGSIVSEVFPVELSVRASTGPVKAK